MSNYTPIGEPPPYANSTSGATTVTTDLREVSRSLPTDHMMRARAIGAAVAALGEGATAEDVILAAEYIATGRVIRNEA